MLRLSRLLTLRSIKERPLRLLLSMTGIMLGVAGILAISVTNQTALDAITRLFSDTSGKANLVVLPQSADGGSIPSFIVDRVRSAPGVEIAVPSVHINTVLANDDTAQDLNLSTPSGVVVRSIQRSSPAYQAGIRTGDVILEMNRTRIRSVDHFRRQISARPAGSRVFLFVNRRGEEGEITLQLPE